MHFSVLSNPTGAQNVSCLGLCDRDICSKSWMHIIDWVFQFSVVSIYVINIKSLESLFISFKSHWRPECFLSGYFTVTLYQDLSTFENFFNK